MLDSEPVNTHLGELHEGDMFCLLQTLSPIRSYLLDERGNPIILRGPVYVKEDNPLSYVSRLGSFVKVHESLNGREYLHLFSSELPINKV